MLVGISYADFCMMSYGEIMSVIEKHREREKRDGDATIQTAAFSAYHAAYLSRVKAGSFPRSVTKAFPTLFGRTESGNIPAGDWQEGKRAMERFAAAYKGKFGGVGR